MTAQCLWASQKGQDVFSQQRPPHIYTLVRGKQRDKRFSLPSSISVPAYTFLYLSTIGLPSRVFLPLWLPPPKWLDPTAVCFAVWHTPTPVANIVSCRGFTDLKMLAMADSLAGDGKLKAVWMQGETVLLNTPTCQLRIKDETVENL